MNDLLDLANVFGPLAAISIVACIALWRSLVNERKYRAEDWDRFSAELKQAHEATIAQMELRVSEQQGMVSTCVTFQNTIKDLGNALSRIEGALVNRP